MILTHESPIPRVPEHESTRLAGACAILLGSQFRRAVIHRAADRYRASAPELGLDYGLLLLTCTYLEARERQFRIFYLLTIGATVLLMLLLPLAVVFLGIVASVVLLVAYGYKEMYERFRLLPLFRSERFDPEKVAQAFAIDLKPDTVAGVPIDQQNILIYRGFYPFVGAGAPSKSWSISIDLSRPAPGTGKDPVPLEAAEVYGAIQAAVSRLLLPDLQIRECALIEGTEIRNDSAVLADDLGRPNQRLGATRLRQMRGTSGCKRRHYKWILVSDWGGEVLLSVFFRAVILSDILFIEVTRCRLGPIAPQFRGIDSIPLPNFISNAKWLLGRVVQAPFAVAISSLTLGADLYDALAEGLGLADAAERRKLRYQPNWNRGAFRSLREAMSGNPHSFFQLADLEMYEKTLDREILDTVADLLENRDVNVSQLREQQTAILNQGIFVQGGRFNAENVAVGGNAKATGIKKIVARMKPPSAQ